MGRRLLHTQAIEDTQPRLLSVLLLLYKRRGAGAEPLQLSVLHHQAKQPRSLSQSSLSDHLLPRCLAAADQAATAAPAATAARCTLTLRRRAAAVLRPPSSSAWPRRRRPAPSRRRRSPVRPPTPASAATAAPATPATADLDGERTHLRAC